MTSYTQSILNQLSSVQIGHSGWLKSLLAKGGEYHISELCYSSKLIIFALSESRCGGQMQTKILLYSKTALQV